MLHLLGVATREFNFQTRQGDIGRVRREVEGSLLLAAAWKVQLFRFYLT
jgi:hypothetical protein